MLELSKSSILPNGNFREFFLWRGEFCVFKTGIPGGPVTGVRFFRHSAVRVQRRKESSRSLSHLLMSFLSHF